MYLAIVYLFNETYLTEVILAMTQVFENKVVISDGSSSEEHLSQSLPIFSDFGSSLSGRQQFCKVITTLTLKHDAVKLLTSALDHAHIDFVNEKLGNICLLKLDDHLIAESEE